MKKQKPYMLHIDMTLSDDMTTFECKSATLVPNEITLAAMLAGAVVTMAHDHSSDPHKFAEAVCGTIMEFIDKPNITKPKQRLS